MGKPRTPGTGTEKYLPDRVEMTIWDDGVRAAGTVAQGWGATHLGSTADTALCTLHVVIDM